MPPAPLASYPAVLAIVDAVSTKAGLSREALLTDIRSDVAIEARKVAAALVFRRLPVTRVAVAEHFGIPERSIAGALARVDLTLVARAIPRNADLEHTVNLVLADWELHHDMRPSIPDIKRAVCAQFDITRADIESARREAHIVAPRHLAMALARRLSMRTLVFIGRHFGGRDHTTVKHAVRKMQPVVDAVASRLPESATAEEWARAGRQQLDEIAGRARERPSRRGG